MGTNIKESSQRKTDQINQVLLSSYKGEGEVRKPLEE